MSDPGSRRPLWIYVFDRTNIIITCLTTCVQLYTRSAGVAYFIVGALSCSLSVKMVKKMIKQPRPLGKTKKLTYGMPSTHSATITYYSSYICAACLYLPLHKSFERIPPFVSSLAFETVVPIVVVPWASLVILSRVWLGHHTWEQVAVGIAYGALFSSIWFSMWTKGGLNIFGYQVEDWAVKLFGPV
ncbi:hypothetical protein K439DRAFT_1342550 [Ramaria rubella]|nr:hypothetical protein K439DRAFT_1342550 [Ramaria rubella]